MATIKDIARLAGVSQGTVSNVLNGRSNVSSKKIQLVQKAAAELGYVANEGAKILRKGNPQSIALILPNIACRTYTDLYTSFKTYAEAHGFSVSLYLTYDTPQIEKNLIAQIKTSMATKIAAVSSLQAEPEYYFSNGFLPGDVLFIERKVTCAAEYIGFDYEKCGDAMFEWALKKNYKNICLLTGNLQYSNEAAIWKSFMQKCDLHKEIRISHIHTDYSRKSQNILQMLSAADNPDGIFISNYGFAEAVKDIQKSFFPEISASICTVSPLFTMPENDFQKYELNYRLLGKEAASYLVNNSARNGKPPHEHTLENCGFRTWCSNSVRSISGSDVLHVLMLESPEASIMQNLSHLYTEMTGTKIIISVFSYDELYSILSSIGESSIYDVLRLDVTWLSWFAPKILAPLNEIDPCTAKVLDIYMEQLLRRYSFCGETLYALPSTPSVQLLFYRTDLFESTVLKRMYKEQCRRELKPPSSFEEFNQIARFFTRSFNPDSPVPYGTTLTMGGAGVACSEFLARFYSQQRTLFDEKQQLSLTTPEAEKALCQLLEAKPYTDPAGSNWWQKTAAHFASGETAMAILYSNYASDMLSHSSKIAGNIGCSLIPGKNPVVGGGSLAISKFSRQKESALAFIQWMCSEPVSSAATLLGGASACRQTYENYELIDTFPWLGLVQKAFSLADNTVLPQNGNIFFDEHRLLRCVGAAVKNSFCGAITPHEALAIAQAEYENSLLSL